MTHICVKKRGKVWHAAFRRTVGGKEIYLRRTTGVPSTLPKSMAEQAAKLMVKGVIDDSINPKHTWGELRIHMERACSKNDLYNLGVIQKYIPDSTPIRRINNGHPGIVALKKRDVSANTINHHIEMINRSLTAAANDLFDGEEPWIDGVQKITRLPASPTATRPLEEGAETAFLKLLPEPDASAALFILNTGLRHQEVLALKRTWIHKLDNITCISIPGNYTKNGHTHTFPLNDTALAIVQAMNGVEYIFERRGKQIPTLANYWWKKAVRESGYLNHRAPGKHLCHHCLRATFTTRLRDRGVSQQNQDWLINHLSGEVNERYSFPTIHRLHECVQLLRESRTTARAVLVR